MTTPAWLETLVAVHPRHVLAWEEPLPARAPLTVPPGLEMRATGADARDEMRLSPGRWALVQVGTPRQALTLVDGIRYGRAAWRYIGEWEVRARTTREVGVVWVRYLGVDMFADR